MEKVISSSCYDVIIIKQGRDLYRSTPFQVVFSSSIMKAKLKLEKESKKSIQPQFYVNDQPVILPIKLDDSGRLIFKKKYYRRLQASDSSDVSDDDLSQKSNEKEKKMKNIYKQQKVEDLKNQKAPFWQFAWLFKPKNSGGTQRVTQNIREFEEDEGDEFKLAKIKEEAYEGEANSKEPLFHLSLCGNLLKKKQTKEDILKTFYDNRIEYNAFIKDPSSYLNDANLVVKIDDSIYTWQLGIAIMTCRFAYGNQLSSTQIDDMIKNKFTKSKWLTYFSGSNLTKLDISQIECRPPPQRTNNIIEQKSGNYKVRHSKTPDNDSIQKMGLKEGLNRVKVVLELEKEILDEINFKIFVWGSQEKVIISDIDGTITKSDILGQLLSNYIHHGVVQLFNEIYSRNYKIIYMTARAIEQYKQTTKFLENLEEDKANLPPGPLMMSSDGLLKSFTREVINKNPDFLKSKMLARINEIFPNSKKPIYCGFGNRQTDAIAYLKINIPPEKVYNISEKGTITNQDDPAFSSSYPQMLENIQNLFPLYVGPEKVESVEKVEFQDLYRKYSADEMDSHRMGSSKDKENRKIVANRTKSNSEAMEKEQLQLDLGDTYQSFAEDEKQEWEVGEKNHKNEKKQKSSKGSTKDHDQGEDHKSIQEQQDQQKTKNRQAQVNTRENTTTSSQVVNQ